MTPFFETPRIHFGFGSLDTLGAELKALGIDKPLIVSDRGIVAAGIFGQVTGALPDDARYDVFTDLSENPTLAGVELAADRYRDRDCDGIVAIGGGSVIDSCKALAVAVSHPGSLAEYLGHPERIVKPTPPLVAIPTTAGTGSEASQGAGIHPDDRSRAMALRARSLMPRVAICDPELTLTLPPRLTAGTGMDALSHCIEGYLSRVENPLIDAIALDGVRRVFAHVERATSDGGDREARREMMLAGLQGGIAIGKGLGPAHALSNMLGDQGLHHGMLTTMALPGVLRCLAPYAMKKMQNLSEASGMGGDIAASVSALNARLGMPSTLRACGYVQGDLDEMADNAASSFFNARSQYSPTTLQFRAMIVEIVG